jgi:hypothetical protein
VVNAEAIAPPTEPSIPRKPPKEFVDAAKRKLMLGSYERFAARIGIGKDTIYAITKEKRWVSDNNYSLVSEFCGCTPLDLHPRDIPPPPSRS